jgi:hypothetical protein
MSQLVKAKRQANFKDFKRFGAFKGLVKQKKTLYSTRLCVNWALFDTHGPLKRSFYSQPTHAKKKNQFTPMNTNFLNQLQKQ